MIVEQLKVVFKRGSLGPDLALRGIEGMLVKHNVPLTGFTLYDRTVDFSSILAHLEKGKRKTFQLVGQGIEFLLGSIGNYELDFLQIKAATPTIASWDSWVMEFGQMPDFTMAWVVDSEYDHWQNAEDPLQFAAVGKPYENLRIKSNGLPYPLEQQIIDISSNPGRWIFREGYIEAVGALMWFGEAFWALSGANQNEVETASWLRVSHPLPNLTRVQAAETCFTNMEGSSGELQRKLRRVLFAGAGRD